jgi:hypothetical protein
MFDDEMNDLNDGTKEENITQIENSYKIFTQP